jgi:CheY-like chemotaxis protein
MDGGYGCGRHGGPDLRGLKVLVAEDQAMIALDLEGALLDLGCIVLPQAASAAGALAVLRTERPDAALLDVNLSDGPVSPVLEALSARGIPTVVYTGGVVPEGIRQRHPDLVALSKPVLPARLVGELRKLIGTSGRRSSQG